jgi:chaperonin GroEL
MQTILGGKVIDGSFDMSEFKAEMFGTCKRVIVQKATTLFIIDENKRSTESLARIASIKEMLKEPGLSSNEREFYQYRLRQLSGAISVLRVGASTEAELIERYDRVDDALNATKAAIQEGILPGGGVALARVSGCIESAQQKTINDSVRAGMSILTKACLQPFKQIVVNGGKDPASYLDKIKDSESNVGFDFRNDKFGDMFELGIVDPFKVTRCALENSVSAATALLSVGSAMIEEKSNPS